MKTGGDIEIHSELKNIAYLVDRNQLDEARVQVDKVKTIDDQIMKIEINFLWCEILRKETKLNEALAIVDETFKLITKVKELSDNLQVHNILLSKLKIEQAYTLCWLEKLDEALQSIEIAENLIQNLTTDRKTELPKLYRVKAIIYSNQGNAELGFETFQIGINIAREIGDKIQEVGIIYNIGAYYWERGDIDKGLLNWELSLKLSRDLQYISMVASSLNGIGNIHLSRGELLEALSKFREAYELSRKNNDMQTMIWSLTNISVSLRDMGKFEEALESANQSLKLTEEIGAESQIIVSLSAIASIYLRLGKRVKVKPIIHKIEDLTSESQLYEPKIYLFWTKALFLKSSIRNRDKVEAVRLLQDLIEMTSKLKIRSGLQILANTHLAELLIDEFKLYGEQEVFDEITALVTRLSDKVKQQKSYRTLVSVLIIRSKLKIISKDYERANELLDEAFSITTEHNLIVYSNDIKDTLKNLKSSFREMKQVVETQTDYADMIDKLEIVEYIKQAQDIAGTQARL